MNCTEIRPLFHAYVDHELDLVASLGVEQHLKDCPGCAAARRSVLALRPALQQNDLAYRAPASLRRSVRQIANDSTREKSTAGVSVLWRWLATLSTALALVLLVLRPAGVAPTGPMLAEVVGSHVRSLMADHITDVTSTDQHTVKPWFTGKLDFAPGVTDFAAQGFPLIGGRLDYLDNHPVAALVYHRNKHVINVFVWPDTTAAAAKTENLRGYSVINCAANGMHYCLVSDLNPKELNDLADLLVK